MTNAFEAEIERLQSLQDSMAEELQEEMDCQLIDSTNTTTLPPSAVALSALMSKVQTAEEALVKAFLATEKPAPMSNTSSLLVRGWLANLKAPPSDSIQGLVKDYLARVVEDIAPHSPQEKLAPEPVSWATLAKALDKVCCR